MKMNVTTKVDAPVDRVWSILWPKLRRNWRMVRNCFNIRGAFWFSDSERHSERERHLEYSADRKTMLDEAKSPKLPFLFKPLTQRFLVQDLNDGRSRVFAHSAAELSQP
ncbi:MAG: hypothetical protein AAGK37_19035 [Pseudomonadota bacterium]